MRQKSNLKSKSQMPLSHEHVGSKILEKIKMYTLTRAKLLFNLCYEIPCTTMMTQVDSFRSFFGEIDNSKNLFEIKLPLVAN